MFILRDSLKRSIAATVNKAGGMVDLATLAHHAPGHMVEVMLTISDGEQNRTFRVRRASRDDERSVRDEVLEAAITFVHEIGGVAATIGG